jgi:DNA-binding MarR family transcriptional regulator
MRKISGHELRDRLVSRKKSSADSRPTEEMRIEALSSSGNRELLEIIATRQPRSISELAALAKRLQPNVSRSINSLARAGLLTVKLEGRATIPCLTVEGKRKAEDLGFIKQSTASVEPAEVSPPLRAQESALSATILTEADHERESDAVEADVTVRFRMGEKSQPNIAHGRVDLNEICANLLANWWRVLCRRADPHKMFPLQRETEQGVSQAILLAKSTGRIELFVRPDPDEERLWNLPRLSLTADAFTELILNELARPLVRHLRAGRRFDRPVESMLHRTEEVLRHPSDLVFWKSAGALGLTYRNITDAATDDVTALINAISDEGARLDFASAIDPGQLRQSLNWVADEITNKAGMNNLPKLIELRKDRPIVLSGIEPWRAGKDRAREARAQIGLAQDRPVGGLTGIAGMFGGDHRFTSSLAGEEALRGFQGFSHDAPVIVVKDEGPRSTAFLMSRAVGDYLVYGSHEAPIANIYSDRQAVGRAFAAEFMAPAVGVIHMVDDEQLPVAAVANHYGVERDVIIHQYENSVAQYAH